MIKGKFITAVVFLAVLSLTACTFVRSIPQAEYTETPDVRLAIDWNSSGIVASERPDSVSVFMDRLVNVCHRWLRCPTDGLEPDDTLNLPCGQWVCLALDEKISGVGFSGLEEFRKTGGSTVKDINAIVDTLTYQEVITSRGTVDTNPSLPVYKPINGLACGFCRVPIDGQAGSKNNILLKMQDLSAPVTFSFDIRTEEGIEVQSVLGEISGVPGEVNIMSRELSTFRSGRALFTLAPANGNDGGSVTKWKGSANILGIVPPDDGKTLLGDGILTVRVTVLCSGHAMMYIASMNLKSILEDRPVLKPTDRDGIYVKESYNAMEYNLTEVLHLTEEGVKPVQGEGVSQWVGQAKIDAEI